MSEGGQNLDYAIAADVIKRFLVLGMQTTRGGSARITSSVRPAQTFEAKLNDQESVSKLVYTDGIIYSIKSASGDSVGAIAKFTDGTIIRAWDMRPSGEFASWSETSPSGKEFAATETDGVLDFVSMK